jgi:hypothetical protein
MNVVDSTRARGQREYHAWRPRCMCLYAPTVFPVDMDVLESLEMRDVRVRANVIRGAISHQ